MAMVQMGKGDGASEWPGTLGGKTPRSRFGPAAISVGNVNGTASTGLHSMSKNDQQEATHVRRVR